MILNCIVLFTLLIHILMLNFFKKIFSSGSGDKSTINEKLDSDNEPNITSNITFDKKGNFTFNNVKQNNLKPHFIKYEDTLSNEVYDKNNDSLLFTNNHPSDTIQSPLNHGLLGTIYKAYNYHIPLILRPDDIWLAIAISFGNFVCNNSELMRKHFVDFEDKKVLRVYTNNSPDQSVENCENFIGLMINEINKNTKQSIAEWLTPNFTTTTKDDIVVSKIVTMGSLQKFFSYECICMCGLSKVSLKGTLDDWKLLLEKVNELDKFGVKELSDWCKLLKLVLNQFIDAYQGKVDGEFWQRICTSASLGSGGEKEFRGWFLVFAPFDAKGKYILKSYESIMQDNIYAHVDDISIPECRISVPVKLDNNGMISELFFNAGMPMCYYDSKANTLSPTVNWVLIRKKNNI